MDFAWLDITEVNDAYRNGETTEAVIEKQVALGGEIQDVPPEELTEMNAESWTAWAENATITLYDDTARTQVGEGSIRVETDGGFDTYIRYPGDQFARWNLAEAETLQVWFYAENDNEFGYQNHSPWIRLLSGDGYIQYQADSEMLNQAIDQWVLLEIPLTGNGIWERTELGSPSIEEVAGLEIHADTWGAGFTLWVDGLRFSPQPTSGAPLEVETRPRFQVGPNPFAKETTISFSLLDRREVDLRIFDVTGRSVRRLDAGLREAGRHEVVWNGRDDRNRSLAPGVYFLRLQAEDVRWEAKLVRMGEGRGG